MSEVLKQALLPVSAGIAVYVKKEKSVDYDGISLPRGAN